MFPHMFRFGQLKQAIRAARDVDSVLDQLRKLDIENSSRLADNFKAAQFFAEAAGWFRASAMALLIASIRRWIFRAVQSRALC